MRTNHKIMQAVSLGAAALAVAQSQAAVPDDRASALLKEVVSVYGAMRTISGEFVVDQRMPGMSPIKMSGTFKAQKPNRYLIDSVGALPVRFVSDGKRVLTLVKPQNVYTLVPLDDQAMSRTITSVPPLTLFVNQHKLVAPDTPTRYVGRETWNGGAYDVVEQDLGPTAVRYYIDAARIVSRLTVHGQQGGQAFDVDASISKVRLDAAMDDRDFPIDPPAGAHAVEMPRADAGAPRAGQVAPDFSLPQPSGGRIVLSDLVKRRKAVLVTFWFYGCATCREEFPRLLKVYRAYKSQGFDVIAVDSFDERATVLKYVRQAGLTFPVGMDDAGAEHSGVAKKFGVDMYPTSYLVDGTGKVVARFVDFKEDELRAALLRMGMSPP